MAGGNLLPFLYTLLIFSVMLEECLCYFLNTYGTIVNFISFKQNAISPIVRITDQRQNTEKTVLLQTREVVQKKE